MGLDSNLKEELYSFTEGYNFDFVIGSSHTVNGKNPYYREFFEEETEESAILKYFESILENVKNITNYCVYGHLDYIMRFCPKQNHDFKLSDYYDLFSEILKTIVNNEKGIEVNTSGLRYGLKYPRPHPEILKLYKQLGGEIITIGSDSHSPETVGFAFYFVTDLLKSIGFKYYSTFKAMRPDFHLL
jgi:histidinol-phosphatase (PHP family)